MDHEPKTPYVYQPDGIAGLTGDPAQWRIYGVGGPVEIPRRGLTKIEAELFVRVLARPSLLPLMQAIVNAALIVQQIEESEGDCDVDESEHYGAGLALADALHAYEDYC